MLVKINMMLDRKRERDTYDDHLHVARPYKLLSSRERTLETETDRDGHQPDFQTTLSPTPDFQNGPVSKLFRHP